MLLLYAGQGHRRRLLDQRPALHARQCRRLRSLGDEEGCAGWDYRDVLPYFKRAEDNQRFADDYHGYGGPLGVSMPVNPLPISEAYHPRRPGTGHSLQSRFQRRAAGGRRLLPGDAAQRAGAPPPSSAYLDADPDRTNLTVRTGARGDARRRRERPRRRRRDRRRPGGSRNHPRRARSAGLLRRHRLAAAAAAVRHRPGRSSAAVGVEVGPRPARRRRQSAGPSRSLRHRRMHRRPHLRHYAKLHRRSGPACNISCSARGRSPRPSSRPAASGTPTRRRARPTSSSISVSAPASRRASRS